MKFLSGGECLITIINVNEKNLEKNDIFVVHG